MDWIIIGLLVAVFSLDALRSGIKRPTSAAIAAPLALLIFQQARSAALISTLINPAGSSLMQAGVFAVLFAVLFLLVSKMLSVGFSSGAFPLAAILSSLAATGIIILVWIQVPALVALWPFNSTVNLIFNEAYRMWWLLGAYAILGYLSL